MSAFAFFICPVTSECLFVQQRGSKWSLPGGHRDANESASATIQRECTEEISFDPTHLEPASVLRVARPWRHVYFHRPRIKARNEITAMRWCSPDSPPAGLSRTARLVLAACMRELQPVARAA